MSLFQAALGNDIIVDWKKGGIYFYFKQKFLFYFYPSYGILLILILKINIKTTCSLLQEKLA